MLIFERYRLASDAPLVSQIRVRLTQTIVVDVAGQLFHQQYIVCFTVSGSLTANISGVAGKTLNIVGSEFYQRQ